MSQDKNGKNDADGKQSAQETADAIAARRIGFVLTYHENKRTAFLYAELLFEKPTVFGFKYDTSRPPFWLTPFTFTPSPHAVRSVKFGSTTVTVFEASDARPVQVPNTQVPVHLKPYRIHATINNDYREKGKAYLQAVNVRVPLVGRIFPVTFNKKQFEDYKIDGTPLLLEVYVTAGKGYPRVTSVTPNGDAPRPTDHMDMKLSEIFLEDCRLSPDTRATFCIGEVENGEISTFTVEDWPRFGAAGHLDIVEMLKYLEEKYVKLLAALSSASGENASASSSSSSEDAKDSDATGMDTSESQAPSETSPASSTRSTSSPSSSSPSSSPRQPPRTAAHYTKCNTDIQ
jgi:hypothetical protein